MEPEQFPTFKKKAGRPKKPPVMGRPTLYKPEYGQSLLDYFNSGYEPLKDCSDKRLMFSNFPTFEGFAVRHLGIAWSTFQSWKDKHPEFNSICDDARAIQKDLLVRYSNVGIYNAQFSKFVAINMTDMRDESTLNLAGNVNVIMGIDRGIEPDPVPKAIDVTPKSKAISKGKQKAAMIKLKSAKGKVHK